MKIDFSGKIFVLLLFIELQAYAEKVHFSKWIKTQTGHPWDIYNFDTFLDIGIRDCIQECKARKMCRYINYIPNAHVCFLVAINNTLTSFNPEEYVETKARFILGRKLDWDMIEYDVCEDCEPQGECRREAQPATQYSICQPSGCDPPEQKSFAYVFGNMFSLGNAIRYQCLEGYKNVAQGTESAVCQDIGTWSSTNVNCQLDAYVFEHCYENSCYVLDRTNRIWIDAASNCDGRGGWLIAVKDDFEWEFILESLLPDAGNVWLGGNSDNTNGVFRWLDGTIIDDPSWAVGQPEGTYGSDCILHKPIGLEDSWHAADCSLQAWSICEFVRP